MGTRLAALLAMLLLTGYASAGQRAAAYQVVGTHFPTEDVVVAARLLAPPAGDADAAPAIQKAIDGTAAEGGGVVFLSAGRYRLDSGIVIKETVTLRGDWADPTVRPGEHGTVLAVHCGRGEMDGEAAVTIERGAGIREMTLWYPEQRPDDIVPYPWALRASKEVTGDNYTVMNVTLINPYQGFKVGPEWNELHTIRNVYGTPLKTGLWVDTTTDIGRVIDVHFGPCWWATSGLSGAPESAEALGSLARQLITEAVGMDMGRSDWEYIYGLNVRGYKEGLRIRKGEKGTTNTVLFGCDFEQCATGLVLEELNGIGLAATGCRFSGPGRAILATGAFKTIAQFNTCRIEQYAEEGRMTDCPAAVELAGPGTLTFQNCTIDAGITGPAVDAPAGSLSLLGCDFTVKGAPHVRLGREAVRARLLGNRFEGEPRVVDDSRNADIMVSHGAIDFTGPNVQPAVDAPMPRPTADRLFVVTDFGASPESGDNTAAFQGALAAAEGGGTVYVPAGYYRFEGGLTVPSGVELRGCFDVPHHTVSGGSVLMVTAGQGEEDGTPFVQLEPGAGLRGVTFWYPAQDLTRIAPYPWTIRALGRDCWLVDVCFGNAYQAADFWTHDSTGHVLRYPCGGVLRRGVFVSNSDGEGWVEDLQFNPHYALRLPEDLPRPDYEKEPFPEIIAQQRGKLEAMVFGRCEREHLTRNFLYAAYDGLAFRDDGGGTSARVINHGTDTGSRGLVLEKAGPGGLEFINTQLVPLGDFEVGGLIVDKAFRGRAYLFNSQFWAGKKTAIIEGTGTVLLQQLNSISGPIDVESGTCHIENAHFVRDLRPHLGLKGGVGRVIGNTAHGGRLRAETSSADDWYLCANAVSLRPENLDGPVKLATGWEKGEPQGFASTIAETGGGLRDVADASCEPAKGAAHTGSRALRLEGTAEADYSFAYFELLRGPVAVWPDTALEYWFKPLNERGRHVCIDLMFENGETLRSSDLKTATGKGVHPGNAKGQVGEWRLVRVPIGAKFHGRTIAMVMAAYDSRGGKGRYEALIDDLVIQPRAHPAVYRAIAVPKGGSYEGNVAVSLALPSGTPKGAVIRYTLDGTAPSASAKEYRGPVLLDTPGLYTLQYTVQLPGEEMPDIVLGELYDLR